MSKNIPNNGFLSKVAKFVQHPVTSWGDLDSATQAGDTAQGQKALREMIERKRRNDFVRKREFDMLRKLRLRGPTVDPGYGGRPSFFQSSYSSKPDDRAGTLKKIDEIEAQMSMQWWNSKHRDAKPGPDAAGAGGPSSAHTRAYRTTVLGEHLTTLPILDLPPNGLLRDTARLGTKPGGAPPAPKPQKAVEAAQPYQAMPEVGATRPDDLQEGVSTFSASKFYALDVQELALDPEIEEAAIRYASGDDQAAEQGLLDILTRKLTDGTTDEWMALFDLYRATGRLEAFESHAMGFANRFSLSAPQWFSMPAAIAARGVKEVQPVAALGRATWVSEAELDAHALLLLTKTLERTKQPWVLDWSGLKRIQPDAAHRLLKIMTDWAAASVDLRFLGAANLCEVLQVQTPSGDRSAAQVWWDLRLATLRVMNLGDDFELAALDFCVTYEVSPPGWEAPRCQYRSLNSAAEAFAAPGAESVPLLSPFLDSAAPGGFSATGHGAVDLNATTTFNFSAPAPAELWGEVLGDPDAHLTRLDQVHGNAAVRVVSCRNLIRVDFSAAGGILNWVTAHRSQGHEIKFTEVHRLIAAFFHVIGITEHAKVVTRND